MTNSGDLDIPLLLLLCGDRPGNRHCARRSRQLSRVTQAGESAFDPIGHKSARNSSFSVRIVRPAASSYRRFALDGVSRAVKATAADNHCCFLAARNAAFRLCLSHGYDKSEDLVSSPILRRINSAARLACPSATPKHVASGVLSE